MTAARTGDVADDRASDRRPAPTSTRPKRAAGKRRSCWRLPRTTARRSRRLLEAGAERDAREATGEFTALAFAVRGGAVDAAKALARRGRRCERHVARRHEHARARRAEPELRGRERAARPRRGPERRRRRLDGAASDRARAPLDARVQPAGPRASRPALESRARPQARGARRRRQRSADGRARRRHDAVPARDEVVGLAVHAHAARARRRSHA